MERKIDVGVDSRDTQEEFAQNLPRLTAKNLNQLLKQNAGLHPHFRTRSFPSNVPSGEVPGSYTSEQDSLVRTDSPTHRNKGAASVSVRRPLYSQLKNEKHIFPIDGPRTDNQPSVAFSEADPQ